MTVISADVDPGLVRLAEAVLLPGFTGPTVPDWLARAAERGLAGVCVFASNVTPALPDLHGVRADLIVAADEEGGTVSRLEPAAGSPWPSAAALGRLDDVTATTAVAAGIGARCRAGGIDLALAPVADVNAEPENPVIGIRSFGATPDLVARHTAAFVRGLQGAGTAGCAKHWPGHGSTTVDSHTALPTIDADLATLLARDVPPFAAAVEAGVKAVMTAHVRFLALDERPATLSRPVLRLLRVGLGFSGVIVCDALDMHAIARDVGRGPGAVAALAAGVDLLCTGNPVFPDPYDDETGYLEVRDAVVAALVDGSLSRERVEEAGQRVAELAAWVRATPPGPTPDPDVGVRVARGALDVVGDVRVPRGARVVDLTSRRSIAADPQESWLVTALQKRDPSVSAGTVTDGPVVAVVDGPSGALDALRAARPDAVVVHTGWPDPRWVPSGPSVTLWGDGRAHAEACADLLVVDLLAADARGAERTEYP